MLKKTRVQAVIIYDNKFILIRHQSRKDGTEFWGLPGGRLEPDENPLKAIIREILEETNLKVKISEKRIITKPFEKSYYNDVITFIAFSDNNNAILGYDPEPSSVNEFQIMELKWFNFNELDRLSIIIQNYMKPVIEYLQIINFRIE